MQSIKTLAIILAAGSGSRMQMEVPKQYLHLNGIPMMVYSLKTFEESCVDDIAVAVPEDDIEYVDKNIIKKYGISKVLYISKGGKSRYESVYNALLHPAVLKKKYALVLIHDAARPAVSKNIIENSIKGGLKFKAYVPAVLSKDTVKIADENGFSRITPDRKDIYCIQTPQAFSYELCKNAYRKLFEAGDFKGVTDDAAVIEKMTDIKVKLGYGEYTNIKVTTSEDVEIIEMFLKKYII